MQSELQLSADLAQQKNGLTGEFHFNTGAKTIVQVKQRRQVHTIELTPSTLNAGLDGEQLTGQMTLGLTGNDKGLAQFQLSTASQKLQGHLGLQMSDTAWLDPFLPEVSQLKGRVQADLNVAGQLNAPLLTGQVVVDQAGAKINPLGIVLKDVKLSAVAGGEQSERLQIQGSASSGKGSLQLTGSVLMQPLAGWPTELSLTGKQFEVAKLPEAEINISPDLTFSQSGQQATLNGALKIPYAKLTIKEVPKSAVVVSQDEVILNQPKPEETKVMKTYGINSTVNVELGDDVSFTGQGLKTQLTGALKIVSAQETLKVHGDVNMSKASYESYGQNLAVRKGRLIFNGPLIILG
ncbi:translocation/assembly module TamB domain-containing protein [Methylocucumis oryzae]|uniref:Translocation and assembly module TamB C-terminal domain-containing protein n=1 Tax=Methylocucumis oryzae TaxID=1632867 RepID=A0A0F3IHC4_9GAMM|nr:translocation/assembly module TamB domain-containing protein [Methylocucumis oryzae]KJV06146.1 hypothetical protein VZ94_13160 [Methylocucumis oryzae]